MATVTSRDVQEITSKLSSDKARTREEGIKLLNTWLEGGRSIAFCRYLGRNTAALKPDQIPHAETWPFLVTLLIDCAVSEISSSKKRTPKLMYAKTLRIAVQRAEDAKGLGDKLPLITVVKSLFNHVWEVLREVLSFQSEYGIILRHLLAGKDYRFHMKKKVYCGLLLLYMEKVEASLSHKSYTGANPKEELFRFILTLHSLLENPPGDFPGTIRNDVIQGFIAIFTSLREEGKVARKLVECLNTYLMEDGPNLCSQSSEIHNSVKHFVFHFWLTTHDRSLKDTLVTYASLQLKLLGDSKDGGALVEQLLDVVGKDLDQGHPSIIGAARTEAAKDEKCGTLTSSQQDLVELSALVFYRACVLMNESEHAEKRAKREHVTVYLRDGLLRGKWLWHAALCCLINKYHTRIGKNLFVYWFDAICSCFERILNDANIEQTYDVLLWILRSLQELCALLISPFSAEKNLLKSLSSSKKITLGVQNLWNCLMHGLPKFSNITPIADAAFMLLGDLVQNDMLNVMIVPTDVWDLKCFKRVTSMSVLYFISCYFSRKGSQGDLRDNLQLRKNILHGVFDLFERKLQESYTLDRWMVILWPATVFALCAGIFVIPRDSKRLFMFHAAVDGWGSSGTKILNGKPVGRDEHVERFFDALTEIHSSFQNEAPVSEHCKDVRLPKLMLEPLLHEMESFVSHTLVDGKPEKKTLSDISEKKTLSDIFLQCALLSYILYGSFKTRLREETSSFCSTISQYLVGLVHSSLCVIQELSMDARTHVHWISNFTVDGTFSVAASFSTFVQCPYFLRNGQECAINCELYESITNSIELFLKGLYNLYLETSQLQSETDSSEVSASICPSESASAVYNSKSKIIDLELDVNEDNKDCTIHAKNASGLSLSSFRWKMDLVDIMANCFLVIPAVTSDILYDILRREENSKVHEIILHGLCQNIQWSSPERLIELVTLMKKMTKLRLALRLHCIDVLSTIYCLIRNLLHLHSVNLDEQGHLSSERRDFGESLEYLRSLVDQISDSNLLDWHGRIILVDCVSNFIRLAPVVGQEMIEKLLIMLHDPDYRVRLLLARRISVLFQTWDGHDELFQDICSNFGIKLIVPSKERLVTAADVLAHGPQPPPTVETVIITLMHIALHSDKMEFEAVFMMCAISAVDPSKRDLVKAASDNLAKKLHYACRSKYLDELMGRILFWWVPCGVSLPALVETRDLFILGVEAKHFIQYCCQWLLPSLVLHNDTSNLDWIAQVLGQPLPDLIQSHFVHVFSICMALHCSKKSDWEKGLMVLQDLILRVAQMSTDERDKLIKKHLVSIVSFLLGLSSCVPDSSAPLFSKDAVELAVHTVVDGFLDTIDWRTHTGVVDKLNIFRPDRVFTLIIEIHYKVTAAINPRHRCHYLSGIEVLINILGYRAAVASTCCYLFNLVGQFISCRTLQDQCCRIISALLRTFNSNPSTETKYVFGEQLQFLVSKLVACCIPTEPSNNVFKPSAQVLSLLHLLTVDADPSFHDYIRELEPFPEIDVLDGIRLFHQELCKDYSPRDQFLKFVKKSSYLPPRLLLWSLQALHRQFLGEIFCKEGNRYSGSANNFDHNDLEIAQSVWSLVRLCGSSDAADARALVSDFVSRVGIGDPYSVVFHLPGSLNRIHVSGPIKLDSANELNIGAYSGISEELLVSLMKILKKYLMDDSVKIVDVTSQTLHGILSTERGQRALLSFDSYERSLLEVHSKGVNMQLVQHCLLELNRKLMAEAKSLGDSLLWSTTDKSFEMWICPLVYSLIGNCDDTILRLCQEIVLLKAEIAELLLPNVMVDLAWRKDSNIDLCKIISVQVEEHVFVGTNTLIKSIQATLDALNELRLCHVIEQSGSGIIPSMRDGAKSSRLSASYSSRSNSTSRVRGSAAIVDTVPTSAWDKVYWLSVDYLVVAKAAITCGSYFTSVMYVEHWCEEHFKHLTLGDPDFSHDEVLPCHIDILLAAITQINEPDSLYGIIQSHKLISQIVTYEHESDWSKALQYYDLQVRSAAMDNSFRYSCLKTHGSASGTSQFISQHEIIPKKPYKGLIRSLQQTGCAHILDLYSQGLVSRNSEFQHDLEFVELQYEAAWRAGNWDYSFLYLGANASSQNSNSLHFNENLHSCLRALQEGDPGEFQDQVNNLKQGLVLFVHHASEESTEYIYAAIIKLQILNHLTMAWDLRWKSCEIMKSHLKKTAFSEPNIPTMKQLSTLNAEWSNILQQTQMNMNLLEPFVAFRRVLLQILGCKESIVQHLLKSSSVLRKGSRFSQAAAALHELKFMSTDLQDQLSSLYWIGRLEEAKFLRAQGQLQMAINLGKHLVQHNQLSEERSDVYRLVGKWLAETRSSNSRTILEKYLKPAVTLAGEHRTVSKKSMDRQCQTYFHLAHYADALFKSHEERLNSSEWQAALRLRKHKTIELEALVKRLRSTTKGEKTDYSIKIQELQKQLTLDKEEDEKFKDDRDNFLDLALDGYKRCLVLGEKYDVRVVFRLISLWFSLSSRRNVVNSMLSTTKEVQSCKFIPLVYQIASRMGGPKEVKGPGSFQFALVSLVKKMSIDHPYHTILQLLALANGDRIKDKQRSRNSFVVDMEKKLAAEKLLEELSDYHGSIIKQMKQMVEVYIKLAELETKREDTNKKVSLPRDIRSLRQLELVPVVTANIPIDPSCQYREGSFPHFKGLADSVTIMNGINAPKVVECYGSDGMKYRQLAKSGNDDLRQDAVMEQFFGLVNTFLHNNRDTWKRKLGVRTYKVVPFTPSAGVIEWVTGTLPLGEYLIGSTRNGGAHGRYGVGDWVFPKCRDHMMNAKDKRKAFQEVSRNFRPVMHYFFLERFLQPVDWFEKRLAYTRSVATSSMVGYIVGLGDRHSMNILIDQATAEVVHIDLGVAFEQGLMLKTPERVPFRLTRDIIDGMGVAGVEGVFRRCSEETLSVMRTNKEALLTIIEVFIHDPLYKWALSPLKALQRQKDMDDDLETSWEDSQDDCEGNKDATRALLRVKQKLDGYEEGEMRSVHGQVQQLIQDAIDPERLCQMFPGWAAWM